jgi:hypothetical protein
MAGKTFPGIGDLEDDSPPVDPADAADSDASESRPFYSGPTVVDDVKVEEGLKKLRSLDAPPGPLTGITKAVVDALESGPSGSVEVPIEMSPIALPSLDTPYQPPPVIPHHLRETAVGRNVVGPMAVQPESPPPFDDRALRGTLFGHSIHAPEFALPAPEEPPPPGALALLNRGALTKTVAIYPPPRAPSAPPTEPQPFPLAGQYRSTPLTPISVVDPPRKKLFTRIALGGAAILAIVGIAVFWARPSDDSDSPAAAAAAAAARAEANKIQATPPIQGMAPAPVAPAVTAPPTTAAAAPTKPTLPGPAAASPAATTKPVAKSRAEKPEAEATKPTHAAPTIVKPAARRPAEEQSAGDTETPVRAHHAHGAAARRHGADADKGSDTEAPPAKTTRRRAPEEDPDATMAPSIE